MKVSESPKLGIIAGSGDLPREIIEACQTEKRPFLVLAYADQTDPETYLQYPHIMGRLGKVAEAIQGLKEAQVKELVLAGRFYRPSWTELKPDALCAKWLAQSAKNIFGDDSLLKIIIQNLETEGFRVVGAEEIIGKKLLVPEGVLGRFHPDEQATRDIDYGLKIIRVLGKCDIGQAIVVQQGLVLGVEAIEGTDQLLARCRLLKRKGAGGVLIKILKPFQETRADRPTIGPQTIIHALEAGLRGIAVEAGGVIVHQLPKIIEIADKNDFFLIGLKIKS